MLCEDTGDMFSENFTTSNLAESNRLSDVSALDGISIVPGDLPPEVTYRERCWGYSYRWGIQDCSS